MSVTDAVRKSSNAAAVQTLKKLGIDASYDFLTQKLGITTLVDSRVTSSGAVQTDKDYGPLALGGLTDGVTTYEMAAAYSTFARSGEYVEPYVYTSVVSSSGTVILENTGEGIQAISASTAYYMNQMLETVLETGGTGTSAAFSGMTLAGKTGTTTNNYDRWFCGYSPYYTAAVWSGYDSNEQITTTQNPSALAWKMVMSAIHENLPDKDFDTPSETVTATYCAASGKLVTAACKADSRGGQSQTGVFLVEDVPTEECDIHTMVKVDLSAPIAGTSGIYKLASSSATYTKSVSVLSFDRDLTGIDVSAYPQDYLYTLSWLTTQGYSGGNKTVSKGHEDDEDDDKKENNKNDQQEEPTTSPAPSASPVPSTSPSPEPSAIPSQEPNVEDPTGGEDPATGLVDG
jgi:penicillin-binding protein 1A